MAKTIEFGDRRVPAYLWEKVKVTDEGCWEWTGWLFSNGYGGISQRREMRRKTGLRRNERAHRLFYHLLKAPIRGGQDMHVDHLCRNIVCVNPHHLDYVSAKVNLGRALRPKQLKMTCTRGHDLSDGSPNVAVRMRNGRMNRRCKTCIKIYVAEDRERIAASPDLPYEELVPVGSLWRSSRGQFPDYEVISWHRTPDGSPQVVYHVHGPVKDSRRRCHPSWLLQTRARVPDETAIAS